MVKISLKGVIMKKPTEFFEEKRPWSRMKDEILSKYLVPYLTKVKTLKRMIIIVDGFAGCGRYADGTEGSPLIISCEIQKLATTGGDAIGIFIEKDPQCFKSLVTVLHDYVKNGMAIPVNGDFEALAKRLAKLPESSPMFLYIDSFGLKGLRFEHIKGVLKRARIQSTEVLINFNYKALLRDAAVTPELAKAVMDGDAFESILADHTLSSRDKETMILELYKDKLRRYFRYVGSCPIPYKDNKVKYHLIYATNHFGGFIIMNDIMHNAYKDFYSKGRLFTSLPPEDMADLDILKRQVLDVVRDQHLITRGRIKEVLMPKLFRVYKDGDYGGVIKDLLRTKSFFSETGRIAINDTVMLSMTEFEE